MNPIRALRIAGSFVRLTRDLTRLEEVFRIADEIESPELAARVSAILREDPEAARILDEKPRLGRVDLDALAKLPLGTLGRTFADEMRRQNLNPDDIVLREGPTDFDFVRCH